MQALQELRQRAIFSPRRHRTTFCFEAGHQFFNRRRNLPLTGGRPFSGVLDRFAHTSIVGCTRFQRRPPAAHHLLVCVIEKALAITSLVRSKEMSHDRRRKQRFPRHFTAENFIQPLRAPQLDWTTSVVRRSRQNREKPTVDRVLHAAVEQITRQTALKYRIVAIVAKIRVR